MSVVSGPFGGEVGVTFDDGVNGGVRRVIVVVYAGFLEYLGFEYMTEGNGVAMIGHGLNPHFADQVEFLLDVANNEYLQSVKLTYNKEDGVVSSVLFKTSTGRESPLFGGPNHVDPSFDIEARGFKIVSFFGRASNARINALGAHFSAALVPPATRLDFHEFHGMEWYEYLESWDDGVHDDVTMIIVTYDRNCVCSVRFEYVNGSEKIRGETHELKPLHINQFLLNEDEHLVSVRGFYTSELSFPIQMLQFTTNAREFDACGKIGDYGIPLELTVQDRKIVGVFNGDENSGVYTRPVNNA